MLRRPLPVLLALALLGAVAALLSGAEAPAPPVEAAPPRDAPAGGEPDGGAPTAAGDPEALAAWFRGEVLRELARRAARNAPEGAAVVADASGAPDGGVSQPAAARLSPGAGAHPEDARVDWAYLDDVFSGRVAGIPNERRAGLSLREMVQLGSVPYVEALRREGNVQELRDLGLLTVLEPDPHDQRWHLSPRLREP